MRYIITFMLASQLATAALADVPAVVTDIPPVHSLVAMVMGDLGQPVLLLDQGGDAHDFQLRPSQAAAIAGADLVVWIGPGMSPWLGNVLDGGVTGAADLGLLEAEGTHRQPYGAADLHDQAEGGTDGSHDHAEGERETAGDTHAETGHAGGDTDHAGHDHDGTDPHAWLDPHNAVVWVDLIAQELARIDPANGATYAANAAAAAARIAVAEAEVTATLAPVKDRPFIVFHDAYGYFAAHFGLTVAGTVAEGDAAAPGAARLRALEATAAVGPTCIFPEANHDPALTAQLAEAAGARVGGALDPEGALLSRGPDLYVALLTGMADTLAECHPR